MLIGTEMLIGTYMLKGADMSRVLERYAIFQLPIYLRLRVKSNKSNNRKKVAYCLLLQLLNNIY